MLIFLTYFAWLRERMGREICGQSLPAVKNAPRQDKTACRGAKFMEKGYL